MTHISEMNVARVAYYTDDMDPGQPWFNASLALGQVEDVNDLGLIRAESQIVCPVNLGVVTRVVAPMVYSENETIQAPYWSRSVRRVGDAMLLPNVVSDPPAHFRDEPFELSVVGSQSVADLLKTLADADRRERFPFRFFLVLHRLASRRLESLQKPS